MILPNSMAVRSVLDTPLQSLMIACQEINWLILTANEADQKRLPSKLKTIRWASIYFPAGQISTGIRSLCFSLTIRVLKALGADFGNLVFRFNHINGFRGHTFKQSMTKTRKAREAMAGNYVDSKYGFPRPSSWFLFKCLYHLYHAKWQCNNLNIETFYDQTQPVVTVLWHAQDAKTKAYALASYKRGIPILGVLGSWDRPTTKGPLSPLIDKYIVNSKVMKSELTKYHGIDAAKIENVGWPQVDKLVSTQMSEERTPFIKRHGLDPERRLLVYAANSARLGAHEPSVIEYLVNQIENEGFSKSCSLLVRAHPQDSDWHVRFGRFDNHPNVFVQRPQMGNMEYLADLLRHAEIVIASQGSITLDTVAMDTCVINIAFDGDITPEPEERTALWYEMDHYLPVVKSGGVSVVGDFVQLKRAINGYLENSSLHGAERQQLRELELAPLDGKASERTLDIIKGLVSSSESNTAIDATTVTVCSK